MYILRRLQEQLIGTGCGVAFPPYVILRLLQEKQGDFKVELVGHAVYFIEAEG